MKKIVIQHPDSFKTGYRILMRTVRSKDGGIHNKPDRHAHVVISNGKDDFENKFADLLKDCTDVERIYSSVDERDFQTGIRIFKQRQLDADYFDLDSRYSFYIDIKNRFVSSLHNPTARVGTLFMVDVDDEKNELAGIMNQIKRQKIEIVHQYATKNGLHLILKPFNPKLVSFTVLKNHMLLLAY